MISLFLGLTLANFAALLTATGLGFYSPFHPGLAKWHILAGAMATLLCCAVHSVVFTYFIATAKWIQHAIAVKNLDPALTAPTRSFKKQAFPAAMLAIAATLLAAILGAAFDNYLVSRPTHRTFALAALAINLLTAAAEFTSIRRNSQLIDRVLALASRSQV